MIWFESVPTARSAINVSSLSPDRCEIIVLNLINLANLITSKVSVTVPIWFNFIRIEFAELFKKPILSLSKLVTNRSSPTIWILLFNFLISLFHEFQSFSEKGSSMDLILYFLINFLYSLIDLAAEIKLFEWIEYFLFW